MQRKRIKAEVEQIVNLLAERQVVAPASPLDQEQEGAPFAYPSTLNLSNSSGSESSDLEYNDAPLMQNNGHLRNDLAAWSVEFNISVLATNSLLAILGKSVSGLPKDSRTLKSTPRVPPVENMGNGKYIPYGIKDSLTDFLMKKQQTTQKSLKRVLEEVKATGNSKSHTHKPIIPKVPFTNETDFKEFEAKIQKSENKYNDLVAEFMNVVCGNPSRVLKEASRRIIADEVAQKCCWQGTTIKMPIRALSVTTALKQSYNQKFGAIATGIEFEKTIISFFQHHSLCIQVAKVSADCQNHTQPHKQYCAQYLKKTLELFNVTNEKT